MSIKADVVLPAAGNSVRMKKPVAKQFQEVCGHPILAYTVDCFQRLPWIGHIVVVVDATQMQQTVSILERYQFDRVRLCTGGPTRHRSIFSGVQALKHECDASDVILIHDAARPFVPEDIISKVAAAAQANKAAGVTRPLVSTVIQGDSEGNLVESLDRQIYRNSEMPQAFHYSVITDAYRKCTDYDFDFGTECLLLALKYSECPAQLVEGTDDLWKVTYQKDLYAMESIVKEKFTTVSMINNTAAHSLLVQEMKRMLEESSLKTIPSETGPANTFVVFLNSQQQTWSSCIDSVVSQVAKRSRNQGHGSKICLRRFVLLIFTSDISSRSNTADTGYDKIVTSPEREDLGGNHLIKDDALNCVDTKYGCVVNSSNTVSSEVTQPHCHRDSSHTSQLPAPVKESLISSNSGLSSECRENNVNGESFCENNPVSDVHSLNNERDKSDSKPLPHEHCSFVTQSYTNRQHCSQMLTFFQTSLGKILEERSFTVIGIMTTDSPATAEKMLSLIWHRATYLDGQLLDWT